MYKGYLIDLDGTIYVGNRRLREAEDFIKRLQAQNIPFLFLTNNSTKTPEMVQAELAQKCDLHVLKEQVYTSGMATVDYLKENFENVRGLVIGEESFINMLVDNGFTIDHENPELVILGLDRQLTYDKIKEAALAIQNGAQFILANNDKQFPSEQGFIPGAGSIASMIIETTKNEGTLIGKPSDIIMNYALNIIDLDKKDVVMIGDNYNTDILVGINSGVDTILTLTGVTQRQDLKKVSVQPTYVVDNLGDYRF